MRSTYTIRLDVEIDMDPEEPATVSQAATFMATLARGQFIEIPQGLSINVTVSKPKMVNRREDQ